MIPGVQNQHLSFNLRRQPRNDKHQRQPHQFKLQLQSPPTFPESKTLYHRQTNKDLPEEKPIYSPTAQQPTSSSRQREEDIMQRVKKLQNMVLPLVERNRDEEVEGEMGWQGKVERKLMRIESNLDGARKEWEIEMQKKLLELDGQLQRKYLQIKDRLQ